jgi:hypothetical protein
VENQQILEEENIKFTNEEMVVSGKKIAISDMESVFLTEANPARDRAYAFIAIGVVLFVFTSRWFMAGGALAVLAGIVTFFDSRRKYTIFVKTQKGDKAVVASYDYARIKKIKQLITEKTSL